MNILYIAYSCDPYCGSEDKIGWNIPLEASKNHRVFVLTKEEHRESISKYCAENGIDNISFFFVDIADIYKKIFRPPFYSGRLNIWHRKALPIAEKICSEKGIDIIHQIAPIEFRSIGKYYKIPNAKFVCGPIAGGQNTPKALRGYLGKEKYVEKIRDIINGIYRIKYKLNKTLKKCDCVLYANFETKDYLEPLSNRKVIPDTSLTDGELSAEKQKSSNNGCTFLIVSRFVASKGYNLLFDAVKQIPPSSNYKLKIIGFGPLKDSIEALFKSDENISPHIEFIGEVPYTEMTAHYQASDVLVFPSFREASGSVILEAMANSLPVITAKICGGRVICSDANAFLYSAKTKDEYINSLSSAMINCINNPDETASKGRQARLNAEEFTFKKKSETFNEIYESIV